MTATSGDASSLLDRAADLLGVELAPDAIGREVVERLEDKLSQRLPSVLRRWLECGPATRALYDAVAGYSFLLPTRPSEVDAFVEDSNDCQGYHALANGMLLIAVELQGVFVLASPLSAGDDPPVLIARDTLPDPVWLRHAERFSEFVFAVAWDFWFGANGRAQVEFRPGKPDLSRLLEQAGDLPTTYEIGCSCYVSRIVRIQRVPALY